VAAVGRLVLVLPLRQGTAEEVRALLRQGPPVDPASGGFERYAAFVSDWEAILVLEGPGVGTPDQASWADVSVWEEGSRWERCLRSGPRLAEVIHSWERPPELEGLFFGPLPGPGDSEGGDVIGT
jgi:hypothetical protein